LKGFTKDGKFRPTENRSKSSLSKDDMKNKAIVKGLTGSTTGRIIFSLKAKINSAKLRKKNKKYMTLPTKLPRNKQSIDDQRKIQEKPYSQVAIWGSTVVGKDKAKEFEDFMKSEYGVRVKYLEEIETFPDRDQNGSNIEGTGGRNDVFFSVHEDDIPKFAVKRFTMDPPVRWIEDVIANQSEPLTMYPESVKEYRTWEA